MKQKCLVVLGMHRSGTSATMGAFSRLGVHLGSELLSPKQDNVRGFFENKKIVALNQNILKHFNSWYDDLYYHGEEWFSEDLYDFFEEDAKEIIYQEFPTESIFGLKDPRLCILFPFWKRIFYEMGIEPFVVIPIRHPLEVAASLSKRDYFSMQKSTLLWMKYTVSAVNSTEGMSRVFMNFSDLLVDPKGTVGKVVDVLGLNLPVNIYKWEDLLGKFISKKMVHHKAKKNSSNDVLLLPVIKEYYKLIQKMIYYKSSSKLLSKMDNISDEYKRQNRYFYNNDIRSMSDQKVLQLNERIDGLLMEIHEKNENIKNIENENKILKEDLYNKHTQCDILSETIEELEHQKREIEVKEQEVGAQIKVINTYDEGREKELESQKEDNETSKRDIGKRRNEIENLKVELVHAQENLVQKRREFENERRSFETKRYDFGRSKKELEEYVKEISKSYSELAEFQRTILSSTAWKGYRFLIVLLEKTGLVYLVKATVLLKNKEFGILFAALKNSFLSWFNLTSAQFSLKVHRFHFAFNHHLNWGSVVGEGTELSGWLFHRSKAIREIFLSIGEEKFACSHHQLREDVGQVYGNRANILNSGFSTVVSAKSPGHYLVYFEGYFEDGNAFKVFSGRRIKIIEASLHMEIFPREAFVNETILMRGHCSVPDKQITSLQFRIYNDDFNHTFDAHPLTLFPEDEINTTSSFHFSCPVTVGFPGTYFMKAVVTLSDNMTFNSDSHLPFKVVTAKKAIGEVAVSGRIREVLFVTTIWDPNTVRYRVHNIIRELNNQGIGGRVVYENDYGRIDQFIDVDLLVIVRVAYSPDLEKIMQAVRNRNIPIVFDIDDLIFDKKIVPFIDSINYLPEEERDAFIQGMDRWKRTMRESDVISCSTPFLADYAAKLLRKRTFVLRNNFNRVQESFAKSLKINTLDNDNHSVVKIGYFSGTSTHQKDFAQITHVLARILSEYPNVEFHVVGYLNLSSKFSQFGKRIVRTGLIHYLEMLEYLHHLDINLAPLELDSPFTAGKSELKVFEAALAEVPTIASRTDSMARCIEDGKNGFLAGSESEWYEKLKQLIENEVLRRKIGELASTTFHERFFVGNIIHDLLENYEAVVEEHRDRPVDRRFALPGNLPTFTVISILYNRGREIEYYLESFMRQTYPGEFEIVLIDDCSSDDSSEIVHAFTSSIHQDGTKGNIPEVRVIKNPENIGNCGSRNRGIANAKGDIVVIIDADIMVNRDFLAAHAEAYTNRDCDVAIGPFNIETGDENPTDVRLRYEQDHLFADQDAQLQDNINKRSFVNCITRNFSIRKDFIEPDLFDELFSYSKQEDSGFGWEDVDKGYRLYKRGARVKYVPKAVALHISHPSSVDDKDKCIRSLLNYRRLFEKQPELSLVARRWSLETYQKITSWVDSYGHEKDESREYLDKHFERFLPYPFSLRTGRRLKILTYRWHCSHQYELYKLTHDFTLVTGLGTGITEFWEYGKRPLPSNARFRHITEIDIAQYDMAILHFDENVLAHENTNGFIRDEWRWGNTFKWFVENVPLPKVAICHGTPQFKGQYDLFYTEKDLFEVIENERKRLVDYLNDIPVIVNSHQSQREWGFKKSKVIWHGFDPTEFVEASYKDNIYTMDHNLMRKRPHYNGYFFVNDVLEDFPEEYLPSALAVPESAEGYIPRTNKYAYAEFNNYVREIGKYSIYLNPTLRSPMPRSRGEAMMCGVVTVNANNHDVDLFIKNGVDGFYSNDSEEIRDYLLYLIKNPGITRKIGRAGRKKAMDIFNHDRYLHEWEGVIDDLLGER